jgi:hypothetical protein
VQGDLVAGRDFEWARAVADGGLIASSTEIIEINR